MDESTHIEKLGVTEERLKDAFRVLDQNRDGILSEMEIDSAVVDPSVAPELARVVGILKSKFDAIKELHQDSWNRDAIGVSENDLLELARLLLKHPDDLCSVESHRNPALGTASTKVTNPAEFARIAHRTMERVMAVAESELTLYGIADGPDEGVKIHAIEQGEVGNCYFLAALGAVVATNPQIIRRMIHDNKDNTYTVTFAGARQEPVTVGRPTIVELALYTRVTQYGIWPAVIEKAFGVHNGTMTWSPKLVPAENTEASEAWVDPFNLLTGQDEKCELLRSSTPDKLAAILTKAFREKRALTADSKLTCTSIPGLHAYSIICWDKESGRITLRNPWGPIRGSEPETEEGQPLDGDLDGIFTMDLDHFFANFSLVRYEEWRTAEPKRSLDVAGISQDASAPVSDLVIWDRFLPSVLGRIGGGLALIFVGATLIWIPVDLFIWTYASAQWPVTPGRIVENEAWATSPREPGSAHDIGLLYTYRVGEKTYRSGVVGGMVDVLVGADDLVIKSNYLLGKEVLVHYNPKMPQESCLRTGFHPLKTALFVLEIIVVFFFFIATGIHALTDRRYFTYLAESMRQKGEKDEEASYHDL